MINPPKPIAQKRLDFSPAVKLLNSAGRILILLPQRPSVDAVAAALALNLAVSKASKKVITACINPLTVNFNRLFAVNKVVQEVGNKNLVISFPCTEESLEKVSYNIDNNRFNLIVEQKDDFPAVESKDVSFTHTGVSVDMVFVLGANRIEDLGEIYQNETAFFAQAQVVNINCSPTGVLFGKLNIFDPNASSCSELTAELIQKAGLPLEPDIATNLIAGLEAATNNLSFKTNAKSFNILSWLMNSGGKRGHLGTFANQPQTGVQPAYRRPPAWSNQTPPFGASLSQPNNRAFNNQKAPPPYNPVNPPVSPVVPPPVSNPFSTNTVKTTNIQKTQNVQANQNIVKEPIGTEPKKEAHKPAGPQQDWFKPKIFQGKTRV